MVAKSFPRNQVRLKNFDKHFLVETFYVAKSFPRKQVPNKILNKHFFTRNFLWLQNHFLENRCAPIIFIKNVLFENFLWQQNLFLENRILPKILRNIFTVKICIVKSFRRKQAPTKNYDQIFLVKIFIVAKSTKLKSSHWCKNMIFKSIAKSFPRKQVRIKKL